MKPNPFILASTYHGTMIINRLDYNQVDGGVYGVGFELLVNSCYGMDEISIIKTCVDHKREQNGDGVVMIDGGANIGVHTLDLARHMTYFGQIISFEVQERIYYALCGNIAINNLFNVSAKLCGLADYNGTIDIPVVDYNSPSSFGSLTLIEKDHEHIGQDIDYNSTVKVPVISIDSMELERVDFIKLDVEGMEKSVLDGAIETIDRCKPIMLIEVIKDVDNELPVMLDFLGYKYVRVGMNLLAVHTDDPIIKKLFVDPDQNT